MTDPDRRLRLTVLGGYLGSGKTTWLRHQLHSGSFGGHVHVIVNEAAETPVDDALLGPVTLLAGGCCCCTGRAALIATLRAICDDRSRTAGRTDGGTKGGTDRLTDTRTDSHTDSLTDGHPAGRDDGRSGGRTGGRTGEPLEGGRDGRADGPADHRANGPQIDRIVLETSGLADPGAIVAAIQGDPVLVNHILLAEIVVAVDALHALSQLATEPLGRRQVGAADRLILTKTDACPPTALGTLRATLAVLNPGAAISAASRGEAVALPPLPPDSRPAPLPPLPEDDARGPIRPTQVQVGSDLDWSAFTLWLSALLHARGDDLVRVKGVLRTPAGRLLLQTVRRVVQSPEILPESADHGMDNRIVFIGRGYDPADLNRSLHRFLGRPSLPTGPTPTRPTTTRQTPKRQTPAR